MIEQLQELRGLISDTNEYFEQAAEAIQERGGKKPTSLKEIPSTLKTIDVDQYVIYYIDNITTNTAQVPEISLKNAMIKRFSGNVISIMTTKPDGTKISEYVIPDEIRAITGYGDAGFVVNLVDGTYQHNGKEYLLPDFSSSFSNIIEVEKNGYITFTTTDAPNTITATIYYILGGD